MHHRLNCLNLNCLNVRRLALFCVSLLLCLWLGQCHSSLLTVGSAKAVDATQLTQQGLEQYQRGKVQEAIAQWEAALSLTPAQPSELRATLLKYLARADQQMGETDRAIAHLGQLIADYRQIGDELQLGRMLTEQAQAYSTLGQQRQAIALLCGDVDRPCVANGALAIARQKADTLGEIAALGSLGNAYRLRGDYERAIHYLEASLVLSKQTHSPLHQLAVLNGLGNTYASLAERDARRRRAAEELEINAWAEKSRHYDSKAIAYFEASLTLAHTQNDELNEVRSLLNLVVPLQRVEGRGLGAGEAGGAEGVGEAVGGIGQRTEGRRERTEGNSASSFPVLSAERALQQAQVLLKGLPASREAAYAAIRLATLSQLVAGQTANDPATHCGGVAMPSQAITWLQRAIAIARQIRDSQSEAFALGRLGHVYECQHEYKQALSLTQQAQLAAGNYDSRYLWEWQSGRILRAQEKPTAAIAAYTLAVQTLKTIRGDLAIASRDVQFDFRDTVEPVYRELTALYLEQATSNTKQAAQPLKSKAIDETTRTATTLKAVESALESVDSLRLAELQNYLGEDCTLRAIAKPVTALDPKTAVLSSIIFNKRVAVILTLPTPDHHMRSQVQWLPADAQTVKATVNDLRRRLEKRSDLANTYQEPSQQVYDWLIRPFAQALQTAQIETLVFIQDGILRSIPMSALYDGKQFLIEQYAIASTLSLTLVDPLPLDRTSLRVLGFGLTKPSQVEGPTFFSSLGYVKAEIDSIKKVLPDSTVLLDDAFTLDRLQQELTKSTYPIVHLATHGRFGIDARDTFLVTGRRGVRGEERGVRGEEAAVVARGAGSVGEVGTRGAGGDATVQETRLAGQTYNEKLTMNALYTMIRAQRQGKPLELLTLTACETAVGSDRDALGIAGISLQAGARSTVASLWQVDDEATAQLITHFYQALKQGMSRAKALQAAQNAWLQQHTGKRRHPGYWAALILVGNWL